MDIVHVSAFLIYIIKLLYCILHKKITYILDWRIAYIMFFMLNCKNWNVIIFLRYKYNYLEFF